MAGSLAVADVAVRRRMAARQKPIRILDGRPAALLVGIGRAGAVAICLFAWPAAAYRPFDGTDAAVAGVNEVEVELEPIGRLQTGSQTTLIAPGVVYNYGFAERWELVLQGQMLTPISPSGPPSVAATGAFLKWVVLPGVLQGQSGPSIASYTRPVYERKTALPVARSTKLSSKMGSLLASKNGLV